MEDVYLTEVPVADPKRFRLWDPADKVMRGPLDIRRLMKLNLPREHIFLQTTTVFDKYGTEIFEGDIYRSHVSYVKSDGYKRKGYPDRIPVYCVVSWDEHRGWNHPRYANVYIPTDYEDAFRTYAYRGLGFILDPLPRGSAHGYLSERVNYRGVGGRSFHTEIVGNIYEDRHLIEGLITYDQRWKTGWS